jgi:EAL domain-containing protein (putative c-di-GMP-specific phosphodiesterase class I)
MRSRSAVRGTDGAVLAAFQPIIDLRDGCVVGYEALARPRDGSSPEQLFAAARAEGRLGEVDRACRAAALRDAAAAGLGAPFALFLNADAGALEIDLPDLPHGSATLIMEITESALTERPEAVLRTLTRLRTRGWGVSLDDVGGDSRSLATMPLLYPDVIKLDLRLLAERDPLDVARVVTAVGAEAERRHATVLAEGIGSQAQLEIARAAGATLGQGFMLGEPGPLPNPLPKPGRPLRLSGSGGDPSGPLPFLRVTNWKRPTRGSRELAERAAALMTDQASALGPTGMLLAAPDAEHPIARYEELRDALGFVGVLDPGALDDTWTEVALGPGYGACFVARCEGDQWSFATSYDRELVVECALLLMARLPQSPPPRR